MVSDRGPATAVGDLNNDQLGDIFIGGSNGVSSKMFIQTDTAYIAHSIPPILNDSIKEDISAIIADISGDGKKDLFIGSGGADFFRNTKPLIDRYWIQNDTSFVQARLPDYFGNVSVIKPNDIDQDGDLDIFVASHVVSDDFGKVPESFLLKNENGQFVIQEQPELQQLGMITDAVWSDFDLDGQDDLIIVGEWMEPAFFKNHNGILKRVFLMDQSLNGLWQRIQPFDIDMDGDMDYLLGNWGTNNKFKASDQYPMKMYYHDLDKNGKTEVIISIEKNGEYYPLLGLDELGGQMVSLRKKYTSYKEFAGQTIEEIFKELNLDEATLFTVDKLQSGYLKNDQGKFSFVPFPTKMQVSPITSFLSFDFDKDGENEILAGGNYFGVQPFHGRFDSFAGALIKSTTDIYLGNEIGLDLTGKSVRHLNIITLKNKPYLLVTINNDAAEVYNLKNY